MTVVYALDQKLGKYMPTVLNALFRHNPEAKVHIFIEGGTLNIVQHPNIKIHNLDIFNKYISDDSPQKKYYLPFPTFTRLWLADVLEEDKVLWLDVDTIVTQSLSDLWETDITNYYIAGVLDGSFGNYPKINSKYINAGILLFNLKAWRENHLSEKATELLNTQAWRYGDQDIINYLCKDKILYINSRYNYGRYVYTNDVQKPVCIYHYPGKPKPWDRHCRHNQTLWRRYHLKEFKNNEI